MFGLPGCKAKFQWRIPLLLHSVFMYHKEVRYYSTLQYLSSLLSVLVSFSSLFWLMSVQLNSFVSTL